MLDSVAANAFSALSNETRLGVLKALVRSGTTGLSAGEIATAVDGSPSRTSFHLSALAEAGLVRSERQSRQIVYSVDFTAIAEIIRYLLQDCCADDPLLRDCCGLPPLR